jgi:hypothetical protein
MNRFQKRQRAGEGSMNTRFDDKQPPGSPPRLERLERTPTRQLAAVLAPGGERVEDVRLARCFPWTLPEAYISVRDAEGREVCMLETLDELDADSRAIAEEELRERVFNPRIERVLDCRHEFGISSITAETDRGVVVFQIRSRDDVRFLSPTRALFRDVDGNTYELRDYEQLDRASRRHLQRYFYAAGASGP